MRSGRSGKIDTPLKASLRKFRSAFIKAEAPCGGADPLLDLMDKANVVRWRLFREACCPYEGNYVKDLLCLGRPLQDAIIVDNSPHSYVFQPDNALPIGTFIDEPSDR